VQCPISGGLITNIREAIYVRK